MKKIIPCLIVLMFLLCGCGIGNPYFTSPYKREVDNVNFMFTPKTEIMTALSLLSEENNRDMVTEKSAYENDIFTKFKKFKEHPMVKLYKEKQLDYTMMCEFGLMINNNFTLDKRLMNYKDSGECTPDEIRVLSYVDSKVPLDEILNLLQDFHVQSNFESFFKRNKSYFNDTLDEIAAEYDNYDLSSWVNNFFKEKEEKKYNIVLQNMRNNIISNEIIKTTVDEESNVYRNLETNIMINPKQGKYMATELINEIARMYVEPATEEYMDRVNEYSPLFEAIPENPRKAGYDTWVKAFNKNMTEGIVSVFINEFWPQEESAKYMRQNIDWGLIYQNEFANVFKKYKDHIGDYEKFSDCYEDIFSTLNIYLQIVS